MQKNLFLTSFMVASFFTLQFSSCTDEDTKEIQKQTNVDTTSNNQEVPSDSSNIPTQQDTVPPVDTMIVSGRVGAYDYVDLGLKSGVKWATYNVGATNISEYGNYFAWGEVKPYERTQVNTHKWMHSEVDLTGGDTWKVTLTKYCVDSLLGSVDNKIVLEAADDAANVNWGSTWRMPTLTEITELFEGCDWQWVDNYAGTGVSGKIGTSKTNGKTIFLPAAGKSYFSKSYHSWDMGGVYTDNTGEIGYYWTSSLYEDNSNKSHCSIFREDIDMGTSPSERYCAYSVRAVTK